MQAFAKSVQPIAWSGPLFAMRLSKIFYEGLYIVLPFHLQNDLLCSFDDGDYKVFFELWDDNIPAEIKDSDTDAQSLEFYLQIHFTIYPLRGHPAIQVNTIV